MTDAATLTDALVAAAATAGGLEPSSMTAGRLGSPTRSCSREPLHRRRRLWQRGSRAGRSRGARRARSGGFIQAFFAILAAGLVPVPLVPPAQAGDVPTFARQSRQLLAASRAAAVVTTADVAPLLDLSISCGRAALLTIDALAAARRFRAGAASHRRHGAPAVHLGIDGGARRASC